jgi:glycosyltransferase involved in cell wall biosynthesis
MPCLNEAKTVGACICHAQRFLSDHHIAGEIIVADNGSTDGSQAIAEGLGAIVVAVEQRGYGSAIRGGISAARGKFIIIGDSDESYDFYSILPFIEKLREGFDLVMGNRFKGGVEPGAMPFLHQYLGNPILSGIGQMFFSAPIKDFHCGLRGLTKAAAQKMDLQTTGMEFASEMVIKASLLRMKICEVPTRLYPDGRDRPPHLRTWRDGWRHLRFMLIFSPRWLFLYPGMVLMGLGIVLSIWTFIAPIEVFSVSIDIHSLAYFNAFMVIGFSMILFAIQSRYYGYVSGLLPNLPKYGHVLKSFKLETGLLIGAGLILSGLGLAIYAVTLWSQAQFGDIDPQRIMRFVLPSISVMIMGTQVVFSSFFLSILGIPTSKFTQNEN